MYVKIKECKYHVCEYSYIHILVNNNNTKQRNIYPTFYYLTYTFTETRNTHTRVDTHACGMCIDPGLDCFQIE